MVQNNEKTAEVLRAEKIVEQAKARLAEVKKKASQQKRKEENQYKYMIDMDYFMDVVAHTGFSEKERLSDDCYVNSVWSEDRVRDFLENNLGLSQENKIKGRIVNGHNESLFFWEEQIDSANLQIPFQVVHVDSHADLGLGVAGVSEFLQEGILLLDPEVRRKIRSFEFNGKIQEITIGDYLLWAIAYRYISEIDYCANPHGEKDDYCWDTLKDFKENYIFDKPVTNYIQLKYNPRMDLINEGAITQKDFEGFSEDFRDQLIFYCERMSNR